MGVRAALRMTTSCMMPPLSGDLGKLGPAGARRGSGPDRNMASECHAPTTSPPRMRLLAIDFGEQTHRARDVAGRRWRCRLPRWSGERALGRGAADRRDRARGRGRPAGARRAAAPRRHGRATPAARVQAFGARLEAATGLHVACSWTRRSPARGGRGAVARGRRRPAAPPGARRPGGGAAPARRGAWARGAPRRLTPRPTTARGRDERAEVERQRVAAQARQAGRRLPPLPAPARHPRRCCSRSPPSLPAGGRGAR